MKHVLFAIAILFTGCATTTLPVRVATIKKVAPKKVSTDVKTTKRIEFFSGGLEYADVDIACTLFEDGQAVEVSNTSVSVMPNIRTDIWVKFSREINKRHKIDCQITKYATRDL